MKHIDLFSGIGGFALAADRVWDNVEHIFCDNDEFCRQVLKKHWPEAQIISDIRRFTTNPIVNEHRPESRETSKENGVQEVSRETLDTWRSSGTDLLTGGFPCQPFSQAGRRRGTADDRYLWPEMFRVIREFKPTWVIAENVRGLVTWSEGLVLEQVCADLEGIGYEVQPLIIPAVAVNAPHRRDRVWIVAHSNDTGSGTSASGTIAHRTQDSQKWEHSQLGIDGQDSDAPDTERKGYEGQINQEGQSAGHNRGTQSPDWSANWVEVATELCGVFNGLSPGLDEDRLKTNDGIYSKYAKTFNQITGQDLPCLWQGFQSEAFQWSIGRFNTIQNKDYLFAVLWKFTHKSKSSLRLPFESQGVQDAYMRNVWFKKKPGRSSHRWEYNEQYAREHKDTLSQLSYEIALATEEVWRAYNKDRNPRLKALGNAIVPAVAEQIMLAIKVTNPV